MNITVNAGKPGSIYHVAKHYTNWADAFRAYPKYQRTHEKCLNATITLERNGKKYECFWGVARWMYNNFGNVAAFMMMSPEEQSAYKLSCLKIHVNAFLAIDGEKL